MAAYPCRKAYALDAMNILENSEKKPSMYIKRCLISAIENGKNKGLDIDRMWV